MPRCILRLDAVGTDSSDHMLARPCAAKFDVSVSVRRDASDVCDDYGRSNCVSCDSPRPEACDAFVDNSEHIFDVLDGVNGKKTDASGVIRQYSVKPDEIAAATVDSPPAGDDPFRYGWGRLSPGCLQFCVDRRIFLLAFVMTCILQGMFSTYLAGVLTSIERLYGFRARTLGSVLAASELGQICGAVLLLAYFSSGGGGGHRPRWIGLCALLFAVCVALSSLPHWLYDRQLMDGRTPPTAAATALTQETLPNDAGRLLCAFDGGGVTNVSSSSELRCSGGDDGGAPGGDFQQHEEMSHPRKSLLVVMCVVMLGMGLSLSVTFNLGVPYLDDNVTAAQSPIYFAFIFGLRTFGPVLGFILAGECTAIDVLFPDHQQSSGAVQSVMSRVWVGAWWLGGPLIACPLIAVSLVLLGFPRRLAQRRSLAILHQGPAAMPSPPSDAAASSDSHQRSPPSGSDKTQPLSFCASVRCLVSNGLLMSRAVSSVLHMLPIAGLYSFLPKYMETQFSVSASLASRISGLAGILVMFPGVMLSGLVIRRCRPRAATITACIALVALLYSAGMVALMFIGCQQPEVQGFSVPLRVPILHGNLSDGSSMLCGSQCECNTPPVAPSLWPVCADNGVTYSSPCEAGCSQQAPSSVTAGDTVETPLKFGGCGCVDTLTASAVQGFCTIPCHSMHWFVLVFMLCVLVHSTCEVGGVMVTLRSVAPHHKPLAMALVTIMVSVFGNVPCATLYGYMIDLTCIGWASQCGESTYCQLYDTTLFRLYLFGTTAAIMFAAFLCDCVVWVLCSRLPAGGVLFDEDQHDQHTGSSAATATEKQLNGGNKTSICAPSIGRIFISAECVRAAPSVERSFDRVLTNDKRILLGATKGSFTL